MNTFTEQAKDRVAMLDYGKLKTELDCIDILDAQTSLDLALGKFEDAIEHAIEKVASLRRINQLALNKDLSDRVMTAKQYLSVISTINKGDHPWN
ncbi:hypothetical protein [Sporolactobacillus laevolacticus]|uniref:Uncharacterized protein n=1 Tax=Sporolactobacillus laevolacticus DSM 442 TaxID=1395513 RepID=V6IVM1_9BACL|nr:hypothetical protein [Sporolactobacillus laevolacticus]EST11283.1 hypothetical protein P343_12835 [Sporolactobacillus laevolacticus DSM 442]